MNAAVGNARTSEINAVFASVAKEAGLFDDAFNEEYFLANIDNWADALKPAYEEHKRAISYGVFGTPKYVIDDKLVPDTKSGRIS